MSETTNVTPHWRIAISHPGDGFGPDDQLQPDDMPSATCRPTIETAHGATFTDPLMYRARCLGCGERGAVVGGENAAVEAANDHAFPGWRLLPLVARPPRPGTPGESDRRITEWLETVAELLPPSWVAEGGPIRTGRKTDRHGRRIGMRHVPLGVPGGGYDMAAPAPEGHDAEVAVGGNFTLELTT